MTMRKRLTMKRTSKMGWLGTSALIGSLALAGFGLASIGDVASANADEACGGKGQKSCPLQGWMEANVQVPMEAGDLKKVAIALEKAAAFAPDKAWNEGEKSWSALAKAGAEAARAGDAKAMKKTCKGCHKAFRKKYKAKFRMRAVPK